MAKRKTARDITKPVREKFLECMRNGMQRGAAAEALGFDRKTFVDYIRTHEDFEALVIDAEERAVEHVMEAVYHAAVSGSIPGAKLWFEMRRGARPALPAPSPGSSGADEVERWLASLENP